MKTLPIWTSTIGLCASYGQLWIVYATEPPKFLATCEYHPLTKDWSDVEITFAMPRMLEQYGGWDRLHRGALGMVVLAPGVTEYAVCRTLFSIAAMTIKEAPTPFDMLQDEGPLIYKATVDPDFQDTSVKAWAAVWKERIVRWYKRQLRRLGAR